MIIVDLETSGLDIQKCGIWQIGAVNLDDPRDTFLEESRVDEEDIVESGALNVIGKTESELRDKKKQSQKELLNNFFNWVNGQKVKVMVSQNPQCLDFPMLVIKANKYGLKFPFHYRAFDMHSVAQMIYFNLNGKLAFEKGASSLNLGNILAMCGIIDERRNIINGKVAKEGKAHNALEDSKLTAECFSRLVYGKCLFDDYSKFKLPKNLIKNKEGH